MSAKRKNFDGVIVYDKMDYDEAIFYKKVMESIMLQSDVKETVRIELYDSEHFVQSSVRVVDDVISKSSVIFVLLSVHSDTRHINFFCEDAVARLHIDPSDQSPCGATSAFDTPLKCIIKPLQTAPSSRRMYPIPPGLMSMTSIDIFDYKSSFTRDKISSTLLKAMNTRLRQEETDNTKREFSYMNRQTTDFQALPYYTSHPMYHPMFNGDMHSNGGVSSTIGTTAFVKPSSGHHHQTVYEGMRSQSGMAYKSSTFIRPFLTSHHHHRQIFNCDKHSNGGLTNGSMALIRPHTDHHHPQIPQSFYAEPMPNVQARIPPASPESEPNPMDLLPPYFSKPAPKPVTHPQNGVHISQQRHQPVLQQTLSTPNQLPVQETQSPGDWHGHSSITIQKTIANARKANDTHSSQLIHVQHNAKPEQIPNGNGLISDHCSSTDKLHYTLPTACMLGSQNLSLINRRQYNPPYQERNGMSISHDAFSRNDTG